MYVMSATVEPGNRIRKFLDPGDASVSWLLLRPPTFRHAGFDLEAPYAEPKLLGGDCWELRGGERKILRLYQDGTFLARVPADEEFLGWAYGDLFAKGLPILNPVPVVEVNAAFVHFYAALLDRFVKPPQRVWFNLRLAGADIDGRRLQLSEYYVHGIQHVSVPRPHKAYAAQISDTLEVDAERVRQAPNEVAYELVSRFYSMFEMGEDLIPFVSRDGEKPSIDLDAIRRL
ncbi:MAG: hypothetical protein JO180_10765 [Gemmatirosa sp.]|nr:hypothetical protein [Gemmatirosa sp.]